jgi:lipoprotein signal peptidase
VRAILGFATLLAVFAIFAIWANRQLLNPTNWANTSTGLLQKATIRSAVSGYLVDQLYANINVPDQIKSGLPSQLQPLAGPISGGLHGVAEQGAERALEIPQVQGVWKKANYAADQTLVAIVNGGGSRVKIQGGTVSLNLRQIVADLTERLGLPSGLAGKLPASVANVKVITSKQLGLVRNAAKGLHALALLLTVVTVALYFLALYLARGDRRRTLMWIGLSLILAGVIVHVARMIARGQIVPAITTDASIEPAANDAYSVATSLLVEVADAAIIIGIPVVLAAWFAGPTRWAVAGRRFLAPHLRLRPSLAYWITAGLLALVFIWGPIPSTRNPITMLLYAILAFAGAYVLREQIAREFPDAELVSARAAISDYFRAMGEKVSRARAATAPAQSSGSFSVASELERLAALRERGAITDQEFAAAKRELLGLERVPAA